MEWRFEFSSVSLLELFELVPPSHCCKSLSVARSPLPHRVSSSRLSVGSWWCAGAGWLSCGLQQLVFEGRGKPGVLRGRKASVEEESSLPGPCQGLRRWSPVRFIGTDDGRKANPESLTFPQLLINIHHRASLKIFYMCDELLL